MALHASTSAESTSLETSTEYTTAVSSEYAPSSAFSKGWRPLPNELKIEILKYNLLDQRSEPYDHIDFRPQNIGIAEIALLWSSKEIAGLARDIFFGWNDFYVYTAHRLCDPIILPSKPVGKLIRSLEVGILSRQKDLRLLHKLARGDLGFSSLQRLRIEMIGTSGVNRTFSTLERFVLSLDQRISFDVPKLEIDYLEFEDSILDRIVVDKLYYQRLMLVKPAALAAFTVSTQGKANKLIRTNDEYVTRGTQSYNSDVLYKHARVIITR